MKITLSYQTQDLPPPFAYAAVMQINLDEKDTLVEFHVEYLGRESISDDELRTEGFTGDDDFSYAAAVGSVWNEDIHSLINTAFLNEPDENNYLHIEVDGKEKGFPEEIETAGMIFQELIQAVLEKCEAEAPLRLSLMINKESFDMTWRFSRRTVEINGTEIDHWAEARTLMKKIYSLDYETLKTKKKPGNNAINFDDESWIEIHNEEFLNEVNTSLKTILSE